MLYVTLERIVLRPPPIVWRFATDLLNAPSWIADIVEVKIVGRDPLEVGAMLEVRRGAAPTRLLCEVTALRAPTAATSGVLALETSLRGETKGTLLDRLTFDAVPEGTRLAVFTELHDPKGAGSIFSRAPGLSAPSPLEITLRAAYRRSLAALATFVEREGTSPFR